MANIAKLAAKLTMSAENFTGPIGKAAKSAAAFGATADKLSAKLAKTDRITGPPAASTNKKADALGRLTKAVARVSAAMQKMAKAAERVAKAFGVEGNAAEAATKKLEKKAESGVKVGRLLSVLKVAAVAVAVALTTGFIAKAVDAQVATLRFARSIGDTVANVNALRQAVDNVGGDTEAANRGLLALVHTLSSAQAGNAASVEAFSRLGLSVERLNKLRPADAFREVATSISRIINPAEQAAAAYAIFGDDAKELLPILVQGESAIEAAAEKAKALGWALGDNHVSELEQGVIAFKNLEKGVQGVAVHLASYLFPAFEQLKHDLGDTKGVAITVFDAVAEGVEFVIGAIGGFIDIIDYLDLTWNTFRWSVVKLFEGMAYLIRSTVDDIKAMTDVLGIGTDAMAHLMETLNNTKDGMRDWAADIEQGLNKTYNNLGRGEKIAEKYSKWLEKAREHAEQAGAKAEQNKNAGGALPEVVKRAEQFRKAADIINESQTPLEKFNNRMAELDNLLQSNAVSWDIYARAAHRAVGELEAAHQLQRMGFSSAIAGNTVQAYSAIVQSRQQEDFRLKETPQERTNRILNESKEIEKRQERYMKETADALKRVKVARIGQ